MLAALGEARRGGAGRAAAALGGAAGRRGAGRGAARASRPRDAVEIAGSARRRAETCKDIDLIATATDPEALARALAEHPLAAQSGLRRRRRGPDRRPTTGSRSTCGSSPPDAYGNLLQHFTGSAEHNVELRERARDAWASRSPSTGSPRSRRGEVARYATEAEVYERLGLAYIEPELREGKRRDRRRGRRASCPTWSSVGDIRGDLHCHTTLSDGRNSLEEMAEAARGARLRLPRGHRPLGEPRVRQRRHRRRSCCERIEEVARAATRRSKGALPAARRLGGQHRHRRLARLRRRAARAARLGGRQRPHLVPDLGEEDDRARDRRDREPARRLHRPPDRPADRPARALRHRRRGGRRGGGRATGRCSRSTATRTAATSPSATPGSPPTPA